MAFVFAPSATNFAKIPPHNVYYVAKMTVASKPIGLLFFVLFRPNIADQTFGGICHAVAQSALC